MKSDRDVQENESFTLALPILSVNTINNNVNNDVNTYQRTDSKLHTKFTPLTRILEADKDSEDEYPEDDFEDQLPEDDNNEDDDNDDEDDNEEHDANDEGEVIEEGVEDDLDSNEVEEADEEEFDQVRRLAYIYSFLYPNVPWFSLFFWAHHAVFNRTDDYLYFSQYF